MAPSKANRERTAKACKALKPLGISKDTTKSALKRLLEAYENNWMYIEEENYKILIDAIFTPEEEEVEPPKKKNRSENQTGSSSPFGTPETDIETMTILENDRIEGKKPMPQFETPLAFINPAPPRDLCDDDSWLKRKKSVGLEDDHDIKVKDKEIEIEIASSCNGEVKLSFCICKPPVGFCIPSVAAVMKQVEDMYGERFTEFSLTGLLKDICESLR